MTRQINTQQSKFQGYKYRFFAIQKYNITFAGRTTTYYIIVGYKRKKAVLQLHSMPYMQENHVNKTFITSICLILLSNLLHSQSLDNIKEQQPITLNGFLSTNQVYTMQPTDSNTISSYNSYYTGTLNISTYGINTPLTFIYTNNQGSFSHPFNQVGMHPSYKWVKTHIGYASMNFTPYTLSGHLFCGAGVEIDPPGIFRASAMYGRLNKAVEYDTANLQQTPSFKRMGYGIKAGIEKEGSFVDITLFRANDKLNSLSNVPETIELAPRQNSVMSVSFSKKISGNLVFSGEIANSYLTTDSKTEEVSTENALLKPPTWFMPIKAATISRNAIKANVTYNKTRYSLGAGYERVDPEYQTLGTYYFTNNMENMTLNFSVNFFENKMTLGGNTGLQKDNLDNSKMNNNKRFVGSGNVGLTPNEKLNMNLSYSNFTSYTNVQSTFDYINETNPYENWDTLNYRQISQNFNFNSSYQLSSNKDKRQNINLNLTYQLSNDQQGVDTSSGSKFYNANLTYVIAFVPQSLNISTSMNFNRNEVTEANSSTWGPVVSISKMFFDKTLRASLTSSYNSSSTNGETMASTYNIRFGTTYTLKKQHNFNLNLLYQMRNSNTKHNETYSFTFGYVYNFSLIKKGEEGRDKGQGIRDKGEGTRDKGQGTREKG